jgi:hypothetical protein
MKIIPIGDILADHIPEVDCSYIMYKDDCLYNREKASDVYQFRRMLKSANETNRVEPEATASAKNLRKD